ncbi:MAG: nuclear transport factor 2 family protein [Pseudomonas sp.]|uniref:nuclear transport factor 2 family protein n=1 Tax=Pseudomonas sp. TaxID=306 RepID=UPI002733303E|nr:nuclear transport factor 2 family protein [Pseudomonas sp.]MDP3845585.1 nuclear transport factor 2 family protein [Pseudomonas sp.]
MIDTVEAAYSAFSQGNIDDLLKLCDPACTWQAPGFRVYMPWAGEHTGHAGVLSFIAQLTTYLDFQEFYAHSPALLVDLHLAQGA